MKTIFAALFLVSLAPFAHADDNLECPFNAAKFVPTFKATVVDYLNQNLKFAWNASSLKINCGKGVGDLDIAEEGCTVTFSAKDGTAFFLRDDTQFVTDQWGNTQEVPTSSNSMSVILIAREQATNDEGNYVGPVTCQALINAPGVVNKKTGVELSLYGEDFGTVSYKP